MTPKQKKVLEFITNYTAKHHYAHTRAEIAQYFGYRSFNSAQNHIVRLEREGFLKKTWNGKRDLLLRDSTSKIEVKKNSVLSALPLVGRVAAGKPIEAVEAQDEIEVPSSMIGRGESFVLQVVGNSMIEDCILSGDYVIVKQQRAAENGQLVVALVDDAATVKRFYQKKDRVELHPANPDFKPIVVGSEQEFKIEGVVTGVIRNFSRKNS